jgi:hypothetical protein
MFITGYTRAFGVAIIVAATGTDQNKWAPNVLADHLDGAASAPHRVIPVRGAVRCRVEVGQVVACHILPHCAICMCYSMQVFICLSVYVCIYVKSIYLSIYLFIYL